MKRIFPIKRLHGFLLAAMAVAAPLSIAYAAVSQTCTLYTFPGMPAGSYLCSTYGALRLSDWDVAVQAVNVTPMMSQCTMKFEGAAFDEVGLTKAASTGGLSGCHLDIPFELGKGRTRTLVCRVGTNNLSTEIKYSDSFGLCP